MRAKFFLGLGSFVFTFLALEAFLRLAIALNLGELRNPDLYFNHLSDDAYWQLRLLWTDFAEAPTSGIDPELGWTPPRTAENPLGLTVKWPVPVHPGRPAVVFVGDSYVAGLTGNPDEAIPQQMDARLPGQHVYNMGVEGYGVDQTYLRLREAAEAFDQPAFFFGILTFDLDRSVLNVFSGPKPRLEFSKDGDMTVHNTPIDMMAADWLKAHPPAVPSYAMAFLNQTFSRLMALRAGQVYGLETRQDEKMALNARIMAAAADTAAEFEAPLVFVIFTTESELAVPSWRRPFLLETCQAYRCVDTAAVLLEAAAAEGVDPAAYYLPDGLHLNARGNALIAGYLADNLPTLFPEQ